MTLQDIQNRNENFQKNAARLVDLVPQGGMLELSTGLIRSVRLIDKHLIRLVQSRNDAAFHQVMQRIEDELDEAVYLLDQVERMNKQLKMDTILDFLKEGYDLMSIYSLCCDQIVGARVQNDEEML
jgi:hypothetical protein